MCETRYSGIEWVGIMPAHWKVIRGKYILKYLQKPVREDDGVITCFRDGKVTLRSNRREDGFTMSDKEIGYQGIDIGDLVVHGMDGFAGAIGISDSRGKASPVLNVLDTTQNKRYVMYYLRSMAYSDVFLALATGIRVRSCDLRWNKLSELLYPVPPIEEQKAIATFIDAKCAEIDALAADVQSEIDTLEQYKRSVITEAVTKGLDPDVQMKDSGIKWVGESPAHWKMIRGKYILKHLQKPVREDDGVITCFRDGEVTLRSNRREDGFTFSDKEIGYQGIDVGDLVVHGMDGFAGAIGISDSRGKSSPVLNVLDTEQNKRYIMYYLRGMAYSDVFVALSTGIRVRSCDLNWNKLSELLYPVPPIDEQRAIVEYIDNTIAKANAIISDKNAQLDMLDAYKKALIYEYVTGKKETPFFLHSEEIIGLDPHVIMAGMVIDQLGPDLLGKTQLQKMLYLFDVYLGFNLNIQYYRFEHGPYDLNFDQYLNALVENGWFRRISGKAEKYEKGSKHEEFRSRYENAFSQYKEGMIRLVSFAKGLKHTSQIERIATAFAVWNDLLLDGNSNPTDADIIDKIQTTWTPNKANTAEDTWKNTLDKMRKQGIIPKGSGQHTLPRPQRGTNHE